MKANRLLIPLGVTLAVAGVLVVMGSFLWQHIWNPHWGTFKADHCTESGKRQYSARLLDIPFWASWSAACEATGANIEGLHFDKPARCHKVELAGLGLEMWGEFDVDDATCKPKWGEFKRDHCTHLGKRQYSARLWDIPVGVSWVEACQQADADVQGQHFDAPTRCIDTGISGMWGEFDVEDATCG